MGTITETVVYDTSVYQIEPTDPVLGGPDAPANRAAKALANRTAYLKHTVEQLASSTDQDKTDLNELIDQLNSRVTSVENANLAVDAAQATAISNLYNAITTINTTDEEQANLIEALQGVVNALTTGTLPRIVAAGTVVNDGSTRTYAGTPGWTVAQNEDSNYVITGPYGISPDKFGVIGSGNSFGPNGYDFPWYGTIAGSQGVISRSHTYAGYFSDDTAYVLTWSVVQHTA